MHDTLDHRIGGVSQQQGNNSSVTFSSQHGTVDLATLPVVSREPATTPQPTPISPLPSPGTSAAAADDNQGEAPDCVEQHERSHGGQHNRQCQRRDRSPERRIDQGRSTDTHRTPWRVASERGLLTDEEFCRQETGAAVAPVSTQARAPAGGAAIPEASCARPVTVLQEIHGRHRSSIASTPRVDGRVAGDLDYRTDRRADERATCRVEHRAEEHHEANRDWSVHHAFHGSGRALSWALFRQWPPAGTVSSDVNRPAAERADVSAGDWDPTSSAIARTRRAAFP